jgi:hypothetical protein
MLEYQFVYSLVYSLVLGWLDCWSKDMIHSRFIMRTLDDPSRSSVLPRHRRHTHDPKGLWESN